MMLREAWIATLFVLLFGLVSACSPAMPVSPVSATPSATSRPEVPTASPAPPATIAVQVIATLPPIVVTNPIGTATPYQITLFPIAPTLLPPTGSLSPITSTPIVCGPELTPIAFQTDAAEQHFERGLMFWLRTRNEIWALIGSSTAGQYSWRVLPNAWFEGTPEADPSLAPPPGKFQPVRGFGLTWRGDGLNPPLRDDLGWATEPEQAFVATIVYHQQGPDPAQCGQPPLAGIYELTDTGGIHYRLDVTTNLAAISGP
jgi:hypothetical protein